MLNEKKVFFSMHIQKEYVATLIIITLALGSRPRQRLTKMRAKNEAWESHFVLPKV
jgi:hypothetical protein